MMGFTPAARPASKNGRAPNIDPWSVTATAGISRRTASLKIVGALGFEAGASMRAAPSSREYSE